MTTRLAIKLAAVAVALSGCGPVDDPPPPTPTNPSFDVLSNNWDSINPERQSRFCDDIATYGEVEIVGAFVDAGIEVGFEFDYPTAVQFFRDVCP